MCTTKTTHSRLHWMFPLIQLTIILIPSGLTMDWVAFPYLSQRSPCLLQWQNNPNKFFSWVLSTMLRQQFYFYFQDFGQDLYFCLKYWFLRGPKIASNTKPVSVGLHGAFACIAHRLKIQMYRYKYIDTNQPQMFTHLKPRPYR